MHVNTIELAFPVDFLQALLSKVLVPKHERRFSAEVTEVSEVSNSKPKPNLTKRNKRNYDGSVKAARNPCTLTTFYSNANKLHISLFVDSLLVSNGIARLSIDDVNEIKSENKTQSQTGTRQCLDDVKQTGQQTNSSTCSKDKKRTDKTVTTANQQIMGKHLRNNNKTKRYERLHTHTRRIRMLPRSLQNDYVIWKPSRKNNHVNKISPKCKTNVQSSQTSVSKQDVLKKSVTPKTCGKPLRECQIKLFRSETKEKLSVSVGEKIKQDPNINSKVTTVDGKTFVTFNVLNKNKNKSISNTRRNTQKTVAAVDETPLEMTVNCHVGHGAVSESDEENTDHEFDDLDDDEENDDDDDDEYDDEDLDQDYEPDEKRYKTVDRRCKLSNSLWKSPSDRRITRRYSKEKQSMEVCNEPKQDNISESQWKPARKRAARKASANSLSAKLAVLKKRLVSDTIIPLSQIELSRKGSETEEYLELKVTKYPIYSSIKGDNFEILSSRVLKGSYEKEDHRPVPLYLEGLCLTSQSSALLGPFKVIEDPAPHLELMSEEESIGAVKPYLEEAAPKCEDQKKQKRPMVMDLKWPKSGILGDRKLALVDHNYTAGRQARSSKAQHEEPESHGAVDLCGSQRGSSSQESRNKSFIDLSKSDDEVDSELQNEDEQPMIVIKNLREASTKFYKKDKDASLDRSSAGCMFEHVKFEDIPYALKEITVGISGMTMARKYRQKNKVSSSDDKTLSLFTEKTCDGIVIESVQGQMDDDDIPMVVSYTCKYCLKLLSSAATLYSHVKVVHATAPQLLAYLQEIRDVLKVKCPQCVDDVWLLGYKNLAQHTRAFHQHGDYSFQYDKFSKLSTEKFDRRKKRSGVDSLMLCHLCPATFKCESFFEKHLQEHHLGIEEEERESSNAADVTKVEKLNVSDQIHRFRCNKCALTLQNGDELKNHLLRVHRTESQSSTFSCDICCEQFDSLNKVKSHKIAQHDGRIPLHCPFCVLGYQDRLNLYRHIGRVHLNVLPHKCPKCLKLFDRVTSLEHHLHKKHELSEYEKPEHELLECPYCPDVFMSGHPLVQHLIDSHKDMFPHKCTKCSLRFLEEKLMQHHLVNAHWNKPDEEIPAVTKTKDVTESVDQFDENKEGKVISSIEDLPIEAQNAVKDLQERGKSAVVVVNFHDEKRKLNPSPSRKALSSKVNLSRSIITADQPITLNTECVVQSSHYSRSAEIYPESQSDGEMSNLLRGHLLGNLAVESESIHYDESSESIGENIPRNPGSTNADDGTKSLHYVTIGDASSVANSRSTFGDVNESVEYVTVAVEGHDPASSSVESENVSTHYVTMSDGSTAASSSIQSENISAHYVRMSDSSTSVSSTIECENISTHYVTMSDSSTAASSSIQSENISAHYVTMSDGSTALAPAHGLDYYESTAGHVMEVDQASYIEEYVYGVQPTEVVEEVVEDSEETAVMEGYEEVITIPISQLAGSPVFQGQHVEILSPDSISAADLMKLIGESNLK